MRLPRIAPDAILETHYQNYIDELRRIAFSGDIHTDYATRLSAATDNSIYQVIPQAVIFPRSENDVMMAMTIGNSEKFRSVKFTPRGGGTGTNGQSLSPGIIIDCSKHLRNILEVNSAEKWVRVQPGVILDQLNQALHPDGLFFAPEISPSNRATLGGMINTDACGNGSKMIGRTSDHVIELTCVLSDGKVIKTLSFNNHITEQLTELLKEHQPQIKEKFFPAPRTLSGYNLAKAYQEALNLNYLFCGSEGTLGIITECKLKLTVQPAHKKLVVIKYKTFSDALNAKEITPDIRPLVIETIDEKLIELAREDAIYFHIKEFIEPAKAISLVEFIGDNAAQLDQQVQTLCHTLQKSQTTCGFYVAKNADEMKLLWDLRKKSVGIISKQQDGTRRPIPFVEDTAVPPENLASYIAEFKQLLDRHQLIYGMYGHVDAGCVHVRPALDAKRSDDEKLIRIISDEVVTLVKKYGGVIWGEHGKGFRSEYTPEFFGTELNVVLRKIKTLFDPFNRLNPGKIALPLDSDESLVTLNGPLRGHFDKEIPIAWQDDYATAMACNGNGACFNFLTNDPMCPSYKATLARVQSPKGRATVIREWLRQLARVKFDLSVVKNTPLWQKLFIRMTDEPDFSHEVFSALSGCLSCKACTSQCPLNVDVPDFKAKFLAHYYTRYFRPLQDYFIARTERIAQWQARMPQLFNWLVGTKWLQQIMRKKFGLIDLPRIEQFAFHYKPAHYESLKKLKPADRAKSVILLQDAFTSFYDQKILAAYSGYLARIGFNVRILPFFINGKPFQVKGFLSQFNRIAIQNIAYLRQLATLNIPMLGLDPSITLTYRDEYQKLLGSEPLGFSIQLPQEFLHQHLDKLPQATSAHYALISHCTEKTAVVASETQWCDIFARSGLTLSPLAAGCCGMAGAYGHEVDHARESRYLFTLDWQKHLCQNPEAADFILTTGYSCRSQVKRFFGKRIQHPLEILYERTL